MTSFMNPICTFAVTILRSSATGTLRVNHEKTLLKTCSESAILELPQILYGNEKAKKKEKRREEKENMR